jgi:hypothetical protein
MKRRAALILFLAALALRASAGQGDLRYDPSAPEALLAWRDPSRLHVAALYQRFSRTVDFDGIERRLDADLVEAQIGLAPWPWLLLYGQVGSTTEARLRNAMSRDASAAAGGLLGIRVNLWQIDQGVDVSSWRFTVKLAGEYAYRTADDDGSGSLAWSQTLLALPLEYHFTFQRTFRHLYLSDFHALALYAGPAFSQVDGTWKRNGIRQDFDESDAVGVLGGADLWLLDNLAFGLRLDWFQETSWQLNVRYRF